MTEATPLLEPEQALALWNWAWAELEQDHDFTGRSRAEIAASLLDVLTFVACELSLAGRHEWVARLPDLLRLQRGWLLYETSAQQKCVESIAELLRLGAPISKTVGAMARDADSHVRAAIAESLPVANPDARALLETLGSDSDRRVRSIARERLPAAQPSAWWVGKFDADPIPRLPEVDDERLAALRTVALFADREAEQQKPMLPQLVEALALLPTPLLFELVRRVVSFEWLAPGYGPMLDELLRRPEGAATLWDMLAARIDRPHPWYHHCLVLTTLAGEFGDAAREQLCRGLLACVVERRASARASDITHIVEDVLGKVWPAQLPGTLILDAWEALVADAPELAQILLPLLSRSAIDLRPEFGRLLPLAERHEQLAKVLDSVVAQLDETTRRAFVVRGLASEAEAVRSLALRQLADSAPDPTPGAGEAAFATYWSEPALRRTILRDHGLSEAFCPYLRRQLRAGSLSMSDAGATLNAVGRLWGGLCNDTNDERAAKLERASAWHGNASEVGPPTEQEWETWRALRRQRIADNPDPNLPGLLVVRPEGPLHPDDRAVIDWAMDRWRKAWAAAPDLSKPGSEQHNLTLGMQFTLGYLVDPYAVELLEELHAAVRSCDEFLAEMLAERIQALRRTLAQRGS